MDELFDFGFTAVNEEELAVVQEASSEASSTQERLDALYAAIQPLLTNLKANPEKDYIYWPNRITKVEDFESHLQGIYDGTKSL